MYLPRTPLRHADADPGRPVIWTVSVSRLTGLLGDVIPEFDRRARIEQINLGFEEAVDVIGKRLRREHCDVVIAGGSNAAWLRGRLELPLVPIQANGFDLMEALARARRIASRIGLVTHASDVPVFSNFQQSFGLDIEHRRFVTREDARDCIADLRANGIEVIVGTGMAIDHAEQAGLPGVLLYSADSVRQAFEHALELTQALARSGGNHAAPRRRPAARADAPELLGDSEAMAQVRAQIALYAPHDSTVLVTGETGTGKELVARQLHAASGRRGRFVALNCGAISESLLEAELFGYSDGAFTGARRGGRVGLVEAADGGTLFLDEIGELPLPLQTRLLRVLEEREVLRVGATEPTPVDLRVVAATLQSLEQRAATGSFRRDLYYRLAALRIALPSLRARRSDIPLLAHHFFRQLRGIDAPLDEDALAVLSAAQWPGNVRELRNLVDRLRIHWQPGEGLIDAARLLQLAPELVKEGVAALPVESNGKRPPRAQLEALLQEHRNDREGMAQALGVSRTTLWRWLRAEGL
ncbi:MULTISPECIES: propionate catabolism operon regulatory protein PrpR [Stenotrophomonas]|uniref:propionate catabolism operon regulatory protein PrpR n=1 Tax=Stenotrophomonas TaxID=40323 RepID=UPI000DA78CFA|nr:MULTISPECIES: propionate catabolism operon regulatory protein PrpR [Stenotrophomonas]MBN7851478.1 propionate catabolism operon regulatory protein PrpR [Stenotrophomonas maltophilia]MBO0396142.1 propionate catabolism operon regulatory protein PrpR [Stenotrophomonas maltophilia]MCR1006897.1 propionate catabolism operon regulatory protein PrpR [Stenotrophomonas maltophilia]MCR1572580.1 propionate catabolism operon regulatory protein PrpR [Stenotrophomonas sp.]PZT07459.1 propionate catabolism o